MLLHKNLRIILILLSVLTFVLNGQENRLNLMPYPKQVELTNGKHYINNEFNLTLRGDFDDRLYSYANSFLRRLDGRTGLFFLQGVVKQGELPTQAVLKIFVEKAGIAKPGENEAYTLTVNDKTIEIKAKTDLGAMHGLETLLQLLESDKSGYYFPCVKIEDSPRFKWRGLMIDACRHFMPVDVIKRNLDAMSAMKLNVFHWHLSEDQGFRVECKTFPKLHLMASDGLYYTHEQITDVINYARERGIFVVPEFDIPGHATSWCVAYPELASKDQEYTIERKWGVFNPTLNPTKEFTYKFLDKFFREMTELFPGEYFHIGGDENSGKQWNENPDIQQFMKENNIADNHELQAYFNQRVLKILTRYNKKLIGWDEILHEKLPKSAIIHSWRGKEGLKEAAQNGHNVILSNGYYIDLNQNTVDHYTNDPLPADIELSEREKEFVWGGEATMWSELVTPENVDSRIWPRTCAIAERLWSPQSVNKIEDMYRRLKVTSVRLEEVGVQHIKNRRMMIRRIVPVNYADDVWTFVNLVTPLKRYQRHSKKDLYSYSPYTRIVDIAVADPDAVRDAIELNQEFLSGVDGYQDKLSNTLKKWKLVAKSMEQLANEATIVADIIPLAKQLNKLSGFGEEYIEVINNKKCTSEWRDEFAKEIEDTKISAGEVELAVLPLFESMLKETEKYIK